MLDKQRHIVRNYFTGRLRFAEFALTNVCIAQCAFCNIWKQKPKVMVDYDKTLQALKRMAKLGVSHITFTGGEPLLHPHIIAFVTLATQLKIHTSVLNAAPQLLMKDDILQKLEAAGCDLISISFDSGDAAIMEASRKVAHIMDDMRQAMTLIQKTRLTSMASVLIWNDNCEKLDEVCENAKNMGFDFISFNYPTFSESDVYELGGEAINFSREKLIAALETAIVLKKSRRYNIINSVASMRNIIAYLQDPDTVSYRCLGGRRVMFVDWFFDVYPCMQLPTPLGNILTMDDKALDIPTCNACNMSWYRDLSVLFQGVRSLPILAGSLLESRKIL